MHELAICQSLFDQATRIAAKNHAKVIEKIVVSIGPLSGVEAPLLKHAFDIARLAAGHPAATLEIETVPLVVKCTKCGQNSEVAVNKLLCQHCGDWQVRVVQGEDMMLKTICLADNVEDDTENNAENSDEFSQAKTGQKKTGVLYV